MDRFIANSALDSSPSTVDSLKYEYMYFFENFWGDHVYYHYKVCSNVISRLSLSIYVVRITFLLSAKFHVISFVQIAVRQVTSCGTPKLLYSQSGSNFTFLENFHFMIKSFYASVQSFEAITRLI